MLYGVAYDLGSALHNYFFQPVLSYWSNLKPVNYNGQNWDPGISIHAVDILFVIYLGPGAGGELSGRVRCVINSFMGFF